MFVGVSVKHSQENTYVGVSFLIKLLAWRPATLLKRDSNTLAFLWILRNFYDHLFFRTPLVDASVDYASEAHNSMKLMRGKYYF